MKRFQYKGTFKKENKTSMIGFKVNSEDELFDKIDELEKQGWNYCPNCVSLHKSDILKDCTIIL